MGKSFEKFGKGKAEKSDFKEKYELKDFPVYNDSLVLLETAGFPEAEARDILQDDTNPFVGEFLDFTEEFSVNGLSVNAEESRKFKRLMLSSGTVPSAVDYCVFWKKRIWPVFKKYVKEGELEGILFPAIETKTPEIMRTIIFLANGKSLTAEDLDRLKKEIDLLKSGFLPEQVLTKHRLEADGVIDSIYKGNSFDRAVCAMMLLGYSRGECVEILQDNTNPYVDGLIGVLGGMPENGYKIDPGQVIKEGDFTFGYEGTAKFFLLPGVRRGIHWKKKIYPELLKILTSFGLKYEDYSEAIWALAGRLDEKRSINKKLVFDQIDGLESLIIRDLISYLSKHGEKDVSPDLLERMRFAFGYFVFDLKIKSRIVDASPLVNDSEIRSLVAYASKALKARMFATFVLLEEEFSRNGLKNGLYEANRKFENCLEYLESGGVKNKPVNSADVLFAEKLSKGGILEANKELDDYLKYLENKGIENVDEGTTKNATQELFDNLIYASSDSLKRSRTGAHLLAKFERELFSMKFYGTTEK